MEELFKLHIRAGQLLLDKHKDMDVMGITHFVCKLSYIQLIALIAHLESEK